VQIFEPNAQVSVRNVRKRLKTFENIRKLSGNIRKYSTIFYLYAQMIEICHEEKLDADFAG